MRRFKPPYPAEFRARVVDLVRGGRTLLSLVREFGVTDTTIRNWVRQADLDQGRRTDGLTTEEKQELSRLRKENARLREERDILEKAAAWFAQEAVGTRKKRSDS
jgi:transposase-like protein